MQKVGLSPNHVCKLYFFCFISGVRRDQDPNLFSGNICLGEIALMRSCITTRTMLVPHRRIQSPRKAHFGLREILGEHLGHMKLNIDCHMLLLFHTRMKEQLTLKRSKEDIAKKRKIRRLKCLENSKYSNSQNTPKKIKMWKRVILIAQKYSILQ